MGKTADKMFEAMAAADSDSGSEFFKAGNHTKCELLSVVRKEDGFKGDSVTFKFKIHDSDIESEIGTTRAWIGKLDNPNTKVRNFTTIKNLFFALQGKEPASIPKAEKDPKEHVRATNLFRCATNEEFLEEFIEKNSKDEKSAQAVREAVNFIGSYVSIEAFERVKPATDDKKEMVFVNLSFSPYVD